MTTYATQLVTLLEDDERFRLSAGDVLVVEPYHLDPADKYRVIARLRDGFDPECNVYRYQVRAASLDDVQRAQALGNPGGQLARLFARVAE